MSPIDNTPELKKYIDLEAEQARIGVEISNLVSLIIKKYCPFKEGDRVLYGRDLERRGVIHRIYFDPGRGIGGFRYSVFQCKKDWEKWSGRNAEWVGKHDFKSDRIEKFSE
jgi:hypothetical protein